MASFVKLIFLCLIAGGLLSSCNPLNKEKGILQLRDGTLPPMVIQQEPIAPNFKSMYENYIKVSCLDCHNSNSGRVSFETKQDIIDNADDIIFYTEDGCMLGSCMPELDRDGKPKRPIPTKEVVEAFKKWAENNFEDL
ncbi:MAG: hypothetical protein CME70_24110 [Halobacteriovorax sp.]|nr:hypothetical protein [Halobacteriovorax sp.]|tara:strand:- start:8091 stop:8504 length:414 start_codon:yes stop_codon:yes gene_type:complete